LPAVTSGSDWFSQIRCYSDFEVRPGPGETVSGSELVHFSWPNTNQLPDGYFYAVSAYGADDGYASRIAHGLTRELAIDLRLPANRAGDIVWYVTLADANGNPVNHGRCAFTSSLMNVNPPSGIKGIHFWFDPFPSGGGSGYP
jgi:hypothetical protein